MARVVVFVLSSAREDSAMRDDAEGECGDWAEKDSARARISLAEAMRAERSEKAVERTASFFWRRARPRSSRPVMPAERVAEELSVLIPLSLAPFVTGEGIGGADWRSHFRCVMAPLSRS